MSHSSAYVICARAVDFLRVSCLVYEPMAPSASLNDHDDDGWDPAWDAGVGVHGASSAAHVSSWADFFAESNARTDAAMRAAGVDPKRCVTTHSGAHANTSCR